MVLVESREVLGYGNCAEEVVVAFIRDLGSRIRCSAEGICQSHKQYEVLHD